MYTGWVVGAGGHDLGSTVTAIRSLLLTSASVNAESSPSVGEAHPAETGALPVIIQISYVFPAPGDGRSSPQTSAPG